MVKFSICLAYLFTIRIIVQINALAVDEQDAARCPEVKSDFKCTTPQCIHSASAILNNMNQSVDPCNNFYDFACGNFPKHHVIPDDQSFITGYSLINDDVMRQMKHILEEPIADNEARHFAMAKTLYNLCYDTKTIEENGIAPIQSILTRLGGWPLVEGSKWKEENFDWKTTTYNIQNEGFSVHDILPISVGTNVKNSSQRMIQISQGKLELDQETLLKGLENDVIQAYYDYIIEIAVLLGANRDTALTEFKEVIDFEMEIAKIIIPRGEMRNISLNVNQMTIRDLQENFGGIFWVEYINNALSNKPNVTVTLDDFVDVEVPSYLTNLIPLLNRTSQRVLHNHLLCRVVTDSVKYLPKKFKKAHRRFAETRLGAKAMIPKWMECVNTVNWGMGLATSALYARKYFNAAVKRNVRQMVKDIRDTFNDVLNDIEWMDKETKAKALEKKYAMTAIIGHPSIISFNWYIEGYYAKLNFSSHNYLESILKINSFLEHKVSIWPASSNSMNVNAFYAPQANIILLPAGILQGIFFNNDRPHYMNYGSIGYVVGHEITHGFDDIGRQFDKNGQLSEWWGEDTKKLFMEKAQCFIDQYSNFTEPRVKMHLNGLNTQGENIADNGGIKKAYLAYEKWIKRNGEEPGLPGLNYTPKQLFWISAANLWCIKQRKAHLKLQIQANEHSPANFRVIGPLKNSENFAKDFNCPLESYMNPSQKCKIW